MKIAIVGSGKVGQALGAWAALKGHAVCFSSHHLEKAERAAERAGHGARALDVASAVSESELVLLTLPFAEASSVLESIGEKLTGKVLVDVTNPITKDHADLTIGHTDSGAEQIAQMVPEAHVVKAFNAVFAEVYAERKSGFGQEPIAIFYAGDDADSKQLVASLISSLGFDAVDAGPLKNARYLEPLSLLNIHLGRFLGYGTMIGFSLTRQKRG
jgi:NADPH-dependent F420 reductase